MNALQLKFENSSIGVVLKDVILSFEIWLPYRYVQKCHMNTCISCSFSTRVVHSGYFFNVTLRRRLTLGYMNVFRSFYVPMCDERYSYVDSTTTPVQSLATLFVLLSHVCFYIVVILYIWTIYIRTFKYIIDGIFEFIFSWSNVWLCLGSLDVIVRFEKMSRNGDCSHVRRPGCPRVRMSEGPHVRRSGWLMV